MTEILIAGAILATMLVDRFFYRSKLIRILSMEVITDDPRPGKPIKLQLQYELLHSLDFSRAEVFLRDEQCPEHVFRLDKPSLSHAKIGKNDQIFTYDLPEALLHHNWVIEMHIKASPRLHNPLHSIVMPLTLSEARFSIAKG